MATPYAEHVGDRDPVEVLRTSLDDYEAIVPSFSPALWAASYAPGKWTAREIMLHVAQWEMILGVRLRCGLALPRYMVQPMDQDPFMEVEAPAVDGPSAWTAFRGMREINILLARSLTRSQRVTPVQHPERGTIDVNDILTTLAGHGVHHLKQLQQLR